MSHHHTRPGARRRPAGRRPSEPVIAGPQAASTRSDRVRETFRRVRAVVCSRRRVLARTLVVASVTVVGAWTTSPAWFGALAGAVLGLGFAGMLWAYAVLSPRLGRLTATAALAATAGLVTGALFALLPLCDGGLTCSPGEAGAAGSAGLLMVLTVAGALLPVAWAARTTPRVWRRGVALVRRWW